MLLEYNDIMFYYEVWVRTNRYHSSDPLTYSSEVKLKTGSLVSIELKKTLVPGFVISETVKPKFKTKPITALYDIPPLPRHSIALASWVKEYYPSPLGIVAQQFLPAKIPVELSLPVIKSVEPNISSLPKLNDQQKKAVDIIKDSGTFLLHGRTGTGKTRVYIELALKALKSNRSAIILSPEIGLSSQLFENFKEIFGDRVIAIHSGQSSKERQNSWYRCLTSDVPLVVIGPRSALFSPLKNIGLIVVDEVHDTAYKQEQLPHYEARGVASTLSKLTNSVLILGSATPSINDYYLAKINSRPIIELTELAKGPSPKSKTEIVDLKDKDYFTVSNILSDPLIKAMKDSLSSRQQSLIFLNRRGTSRLVLCENCGWEALCPNCNLPLVYHGDVHQLRCHTCGYALNSIPTICPNCESDAILFTTAGTKGILSEVEKIFRGARIKRFDTDNLKAESIGNLYSAVLAGDVDILIGTQQLTKGFDLPNLTTVGILQADTTLYIPDYTSSERSFQLITQVLGRISRGHQEGTAVIQTYNPTSLLLRTAIDQDYKAFYEKEIAERKKFKLPPFYSLLKLTCRRSTTKSAEEAANKLKAELVKQSGIQVDGPAPSFHERIQGKYQWQIVVKSTSRNKLLEVIKLIPSGWTYDIDPANLL